MSDEAFDDRYVRFREHADVRERVTALEGHQTQVMAILSRIETTLTARPVIPPSVAAPQETAAALALHRALDAYDRNSKKGDTNPVLLFFASVGFVALGAAVAWLVLHH